MAKATCSKHKRFVPTCDPCKSAALRETVGFPDGGAEQNMGGITGVPEADETVNDIPDYEPDEEELPPRPSKEPPNDPDPQLQEALVDARSEDIDETEPLVAAPVEPDKADGEGEPEQMSPIEMAVAMFPPRLMHQEIAPFIEKTLASYMELGLTAEDAVIVTAGEVIHAEQLSGLEPEAEADDEVEEAFEAGVEAAPEISSCIEDYNQGFNEGMAAVRDTLRTYYSGDEDAVAYSLGQWLDKQIARMKK